MMYNDKYGFNTYAIINKNWKIKFDKQFKDEIMLIIENLNGETISSFSINETLFCSILYGMGYVLKFFNKNNPDFILERIVSDSQYYKYNIKYDGTQMLLTYEEKYEEDNECQQNCIIINIDEDSREKFQIFFDDVLKYETSF